MKEDTAIRKLKRRICEIEADLAKRKSDYFNHGIESPMKERAALESELASLKLVRFDLDNRESARKAEVRKLRGELLKQRLQELGLAHLVAECNEIAEATIPPIEQPEVTP